MIRIIFFAIRMNNKNNFCNSNYNSKTIVVIHCELNTNSNSFEYSIDSYINQRRKLNGDIDVLT